MCLVILNLILGVYLICIHSIVMPFNLPIFLTWLRIVSIPLLVCVFYLPDCILSTWERGVLSALIFLTASLTDWLDGFFARRLKQTSAFGAFLDPVADKLMVSVALLILLDSHRINVMIAIIIIGREIAISALREWMARIGASQSVAVSWLGKIKTIFQMLAIPMLLCQKLPSKSEHFSLPIMGTVMMNLSALLTLWSMFYYIRLAWPNLSKNV